MPKYYRFAEVICDHYRSAPVGTELPPLTELAKRFSVSKETINRSMRHLAAKGLVRSERGRGTKIIRSFSEAFPLNGRSNRPQGRASPESATSAGAVGLVLIPRSGMPNPDEHVYETPIVAGLQHRLSNEEIHLSYIVINDQAGYGLQRQLGENSRLGGFVFMSDMLDRPTAVRVAALGRPCVVINEEQFEDILTCVVADEEQGVENAVKHLVDLGHRQIGFVWAPHQQQEARLRGFKKAMKTNGLAIHSKMIFEIDHGNGAFQMQEGNKLATWIKRQHPSCTALVTSCGELAGGLAQGFKDLGIKLGKQISLIGFGIPEQEFSLVKAGEGRITTIAKPRYEMGRCAAEILIQQMRGGYAQSGLVKLKTKLLIGDSTGPASH
jgi:DNA-binding LacI/PurR family transcriptional regulator